MDGSLWLNQDEIYRVCVSDGFQVGLDYSEHGKVVDVFTKPEMSTSPAETLSTTLYSTSLY